MTNEETEFENCGVYQDYRAEKFRDTFYNFHFKKKLEKFYTWSQLRMLLKLGHFGKYIGNTWKVAKCGAG